MIWKICRNLGVTSVLAIAMLHGQQSHAASALDGATVRVIIAHKAGNTTDTMARLFAKALEKHLPETSINVQNLDGNGGTLAMNEIHAAQGSLVTIGFVNSSVVFTQVTQGEAMPYGLKEFHWIGALASSQRVLVVRKDVIDRADPAKLPGKPLVSLAMSASAHNYIDGLLLNSMTNLRLKMVPGFKTDQQNAMLLAGDADAGIGTYENYREFIEAGDLVPILKFGTVGYPDELKTLPTLAEIALPTASGDVISLATQLSDMGRFVVAAPHTTPAQREALVVAFNEVVADPGYLRALKDANFIATPEDSAKVTRFMNDLLGNHAVVAKLRAAIECGQQISDGVVQSCDLAM
ncbi:Bug family tripartite tricarboxylate transporter substrate binding protein [Dongia deserti]|uniref:Bug family tripartite tricarboxylate transporter substrate binding protein n=1 Tax=Dongia deserti TaxID=2268030 RepID=UPI0013C516BD|nr:tripartite tricarboxylate transporter substrate-binding protein [Dongia deserti]